MRKLSLILVAAAVLSAGSVFAKESEKPKPLKSLAYQVSQILDYNNIWIEKDEVMVKVLFTVNQDSEIEVLEVEASQGDLEHAVKMLLNKKKVDFAAQTPDKKFLIPVRIKS